MHQDLTTQLIEKAIERAAEIGIQVCVAVVDNGPILTGFLKMEGAFKGSVDVAIKKARTSVLFPMPTSTFGHVIRDKQLTGMELSNDGLIGFAGGIPIVAGNKQIGAIGISGGSADQDEDIATFAVQSITS